MEFHVSSFWLEISHSGPNFGVFGVNRGQISIFHFMTPKRQGTSLRDSASFEPLRVKIRPGVSSLRWSEKKNKKSHKKVIFHPFAQKSRVNGFFKTKFGTNTPLIVQGLGRFSCA